MKFCFYFFALLFIAGCSNTSSTMEAGNWQATLTREDGKLIPFTIESKDSAGHTFWQIHNGKEHLLVDSIVYKDDSVIVVMPFFESSIHAKLTDGKLNGGWVKMLDKGSAMMPFYAIKTTDEKFGSAINNNEKKVGGRWAVTFVGTTSGDTTLSVGEFVQDGNKVTGTFLNPTGDYRFLSGLVDADTLKLSCFDGGHAFLFTALVGDSTISNGYFYSGLKSVEKWTAYKNDSAALGDEYALTKLKPGAAKPAFTFRSIAGDSVSIQDDKFKGHVVLLQLMGSWCPNCMDETNFLSSYYNRHHSEGIDILGLAYERSTDFERAQKNLGSFKKRFDVQYPILFTGVTVTDSLRAEKTLPMLDKIVAFPTLIFLDKKGNIRKIHSGFTGPGTGEHYQHFIDDFDKIVGDLLKEQS